jgi:hypothetical protein
MIFKEVVMASNFEDFYTCLEIYHGPKIVGGRELIKEGYEEIRQMRPAKPDEHYMIAIGIIEEDGCLYHDVSGISEKEDILFSLLFDEWENWLSYDVEPELFKDLTCSEITAHCYWEMSSYGWTVEDRKQRLELEHREALVEEELESQRDIFIKDKILVTNDFLSKVIELYGEAKTLSLETSIELIIEELIKNKLFSDQQLKLIDESFDDEDIQLALCGVGK